MPEKIVFVGGGSSWVPGHIQVMLESYELFDKSEICLLDIKESPYLKLMADVLKALWKKTKIDIKITTTTDPKEALKGATYIFILLNIGGKDTLKNDITVPPKYGIAGDETAGFGGTFMAQRNIPVVVEYCKLIEKICPDAWVLIQSNPDNLLADAIRRETSNVKAVFKCDCFYHFGFRRLPRILGIDDSTIKYCPNEDIWPRCIGVNHMTWLVDLKINGKDGFPLFEKILKEKRERFLEIGKYYPADLGANVYEAYGYFNIVPFHIALYWEQRDYLERTKVFEGSYYDGVLGWDENKVKVYEKMAKDGIYSETPYDEDIEGTGKNGCYDLIPPRQAVGMMISLITNEGREWGGVNFVNNGVISNLPDDAIVEGPVIVNARGINPIPMGPLPKQFVGLTHKLITWADLTVDAALAGDKKLLYRAILECPFVHDMGVAKTVMEEMFELNYRYMPQYKK